MICFSTFNKTKRRFSVCNQKGIPKGKTFENLQVQIFIGLPLGVLSFVSFSLHKQRKAENAHASRCSNHSVFSAKKTGTRLGACFFGGEGEIRTLEPISGLHDFQSCALDQLRDFSVLCCSQRLILYHAISVLSISKIKK